MYMLEKHGCQLASGPTICWISTVSTSCSNWKPAHSAEGYLGFHVISDDRPVTRNQEWWDFPEQEASVFLSLMQELSAHSVC